MDSSIPRYVAMSWIVHHLGSDAGWVMGWRVPPDLARTRPPRRRRGLHRACRSMLMQRHALL